MGEVCAVGGGRWEVDGLVVVQLGMVGRREEGSPMSKSYKISYSQLMGYMIDGRGLFAQKLEEKGIRTVSNHSCI
jgi:hypothetical protein